MKLSERDIISTLQKNSDEAVFYAYFTRDREYSFWKASNFYEIIVEIGKRGDLADMDSEIMHKDPFAVSFRSDEWIIFGTEDLANKFLVLLQKAESRENLDVDRNVLFNLDETEMCPRDVRLSLYEALSPQTGNDREIIQSIWSWTDSATRNNRKIATITGVPFLTPMSHAAADHLGWRYEIGGKFAHLIRIAPDGI